MIGVNGLGEFIDSMEATSEAMFRHLDHIVNLVGPQHAGIGLVVACPIAGVADQIGEAGLGARLLSVRLRAPELDAAALAEALDDCLQITCTEKRLRFCPHCFKP